MLTVVFDVETKKAFDEVGGFYPEKLGVSLVGVWSGEEIPVQSVSSLSPELTDNDTSAVNSVADASSEGEYRTYREEELSEFFSLLEKADVVVGFNSIGFDYPALSPYYQGDLIKLPSLDMLVKFEESVGHRVKLDALAKETLGVQKIGHGLDAIRYYHDGDWESLEKYCLQDVKVTKDLYFHGLENGSVSFINKWNRVVKANVDFSLPKNMDKQVQTTMF